LVDIRGSLITNYYPSKEFEEIENPFEEE